MKLIIVGATGFVATEVLRQALSNSSITSIITLSRKPVEPPPDLPSDNKNQKLQSIIMKNYGEDSWTDDVKKELEGADACIWWVIALS